MHKCLPIRLLLLVILVFISGGNLSAQHVTYTLHSPPVEGNVLVGFSFTLPSGIPFTSWEIDGNSISEPAPKLVLPVSPTSTYNVKLIYSTDTLNADVDVLAPLFTVSHDQDLGPNSASLKRIFRSAYSIDNQTDELQGRRFSWTINGNKPEYFTFDTTSFGDHPNIYYTFPEGGTHLVRLEVTNSNAPGFTAIYTDTLHLTPVFTSEKLDFTNLPNVITPENPDGANDYFVVETTGINRLSFKVFSRWGSMVYHNEANVIKWDGRNYHGNYLPEGIYYYILEDLNGNYNTAKGFFYIFR